MLGEGGEEGFQLNFGAKRICWPFCGNMAEAPLRMPDMVRRRRRRHWKTIIFFGPPFPVRYGTGMSTWAVRSPDGMARALSFSEDALLPVRAEPERGNVPLAATRSYLLLLPPLLTWHGKYILVGP